MSKKITKKIKLLKDIVIPAGTEFECCDGHTVTMYSGNYRTCFGLTKDTSGDVNYGIDINDPEIFKWFKEEK